MDIRSLTIEGQRLRIGVRAGASHLPPLIVFNGIGASLELIEPFVSALPEREVVAFDVPGSGGSPAALLPYRFPGLARLAHKLLGELGYNGAVDALGVSWGGALAQTFAFEFPTHCRKLVLASTSPGALMVPGSLSVLAKLVSPRRYVDPDFLHAFGGEIYGGAFRSDPDLLRRHAQALWAPSNRGYLYQLIAAAGWTSLPWLRLLTQPTLVMHGSDDPIVPLMNARILSALIRRAELHVVDDGHMFLVSKAQDVAPVVHRFLTEEQEIHPHTRGAGNEHL
ncbi:MAG: poly(3-hydroxyalkanoate) depolymerase [Hyphomicrobiales bacterium]|nr:poly(3-hydroxyalkanoate) depolymerase [Hyphomicrobiales bacterium]